jgi:hypothetical protein
MTFAVRSQGAWFCPRRATRRTRGRARNPLPPSCRWGPHYERGVLSGIYWYKLSVAVVENSVMHGGPLVAVKRQIADPLKKARHA